MEKENDKDGKIKWTLKPNAPKDNIVSVSFSPELEGMVKEFMIKIFGIKYLQAERTENDGLIEVKFEGDPDDVELANQCLKRFLNALPPMIKTQKGNLKFGNHNHLYNTRQTKYYNIIKT